MIFDRDRYDRYMDQVLADQESMLLHTKGKMKPKKIVRWGPLGKFSIWMEYEDGTREEYNSLDKYYSRGTDGDTYRFTSKPTTFSRKMYEYMRDRGYDETTLAIETGISQGTISNYKSGKTEPSLTNLKKLAKAFGCRVVDLVEGY